MTLGFMSRRKLLAAIAALGIAAGAAISDAAWSGTFDYSQLAPLAPVKTKLANLESATICFNTDSVDYWDGSSNYPSTYIFALYMVAKYTTHSVIWFQWMEWNGSAPTGPKQYDTGTQLSTGTVPGATIKIYNLALPGDIPATMLDSSRYANAIQNIQPVHAMIWQQGKNLASAGLSYPVLLGCYYGPIGRIAHDYPAMPQILFTQYPNLADNAMAAANTAQWECRYGNTGLGLIDGYNPIIAAGKPPSWWRDGNVHFGQLGNQVEGSILCGAFEAAPLDQPWSQSSWFDIAGANFVLNPNFSNWSGSVPANWIATGTLTTTKDTVNTFGGAAYSCGMLAQDGSSYLQQFLNSTQNRQIAGKRISLVFMTYTPATSVATQVPRPSFTAYPPSGGASSYDCGSLQRYLGGWCAQVIADVQMPSSAGAGGNYITTYFAFAVSNPVQIRNNLQYVIGVEGPLPRGLFY